MANSLIIVESPTKVKTIKKFLGPNCEIMATKGHIKDLPKSKLGIDIEHAFAPTYRIIESRKKIIEEIRKAAAKCETIYLAPDPDREGEAIAWHVAEEIKDQAKKIHRVLFNDLTKHTILDGIAHPRELDRNKYEAQQTRRILDRLVGYKISPLLWDKVRRGLSAGRVQSVALRLICEREEEIRKFVPEEYWIITAALKGKNPPPFEARLVKIEGKKARVEKAEVAQEITAYLKSHPLYVEKVEKKESRRTPQPPFTTSKLQQEAARRLNFSTQKTMTIAQRLYEGVELGPEGPVGLITYMRTDSVRIAQEALEEARAFIKANYEPPFLPARPRVFKNVASAQDAHEAIRPTSMKYTPAAVKRYLSGDEFRLYQLIWNRFVASQMAPAVFDLTTIDVSCGPYTLRAVGSVMKFPGFTIVYKEATEDTIGEEESQLGALLPAVEQGEALALMDLKAEQKFTQPPLRFTEASLVKELEEKGIGRPSTYAAIISTIQERKYVRLEERKFHPTELGLVVNDLLVKNFPRIVDVEFTANMETKLDNIEQGIASRLETLKEFYSEFARELKKAEKEMDDVKGEGIPTDRICDKCGRPMVIKLGRNGRFYACSAYPECKNTADLEERDQPLEPSTAIACEKCGRPMMVKQGRFGKFLACSGYPECKHTKKIATENAREEKVQETDEVCELCGRKMVIREGRFGRFLGCSGYPDCKNLRPINLGVPCPEEGCTGFITEKKTRRGKVFYSCSRYPDCKFALWSRPIAETCPACGHPFLVEKVTKKGRFKACPAKNCKYKALIET
ncbi:MAG TPA: type I DNA topoisomerase [Syntrophales bacterium]|nr:type I DNA topoisomerase [Syntrophales bacterium]HOL59748.1 type I DNA topoisomerase [Syntrophales bacterium]HPO35894.1 type I DNA topoisomerase [Syntrophales bacterium]